MGFEIYCACGSLLVVDDAYCGDCGAQLRCHSCQELLKPSKQFCTKCGTRVGEESSAPKPERATALRIGINSLRLQEGKGSRLLEVNFTDHVAESISAPLTAYMAGHIGSLTLKGRRGPIQDTSVIEGEAVALPAAPGVGNDEGGRRASAPGLTDGLERIFSAEGNRLQLRDTRLKGESKLDTARRVTHLFLYAHSQLGRERVLLTDLYTILGEAGVDDRNTRTMLRQSPTELWPDNDRIGLRPGGEEKARVALADFLNPERPLGWSAASAKTRTTKPGDRGTDATMDKDKDKAKPTRRAAHANSATVTGWVTAWKQRPGPVDGHLVLKSKSLLDRGIFALWAIHEAAGDDGEVVSSYQLTNFLLGAFVIKVDPRNLSRALDKDNNDKVINAGGTRHQLTPTGIAYARQMAGLAPGQLRAVP